MSKKQVRSFYYIMLFFAALGCQTNELEEELTPLLSVNDTIASEDFTEPDTLIIVVEDTSVLEHQLIQAGLLDVQSVHSAIKVDLKYASTDNFMGINMYGDLKRAYLQPEVAHRLGKVQDYLSEYRPDLRLYVFDAVRPVSVQQLMWNALDSIPINQRVKFVSNPVNKSIHNYGAAVDVSLFDVTLDSLLDMGAGYDDLRKIAYPIHEDEFLAAGLLSPSQIENRKLLREVMKVGGFWVLPTEWWHFNAFSREKCKELFEVIP